MGRKLSTLIGETPVELQIEGGTLLLVEKPTGRKKRGSVPRAVEVDLSGLWERGEPDKAPGAVDAILRRLPIADFGKDPEKLTYRVKVWLMNELSHQV